MSSKSTKSNKKSKAIVDFANSNESIRTKRNVRSTIASQSTSSSNRIEMETEDGSNQGSKQLSTNETETEILISNCIRYLLLNTHSLTPIKQIDVSRFLNQNYQLKRYEFNLIMEMVTKRLRNELGLLLIECPDTTEKSYIIGTKYKNNIFDLVDCGNDDGHEDSNDQDQHADIGSIPNNYDDRVRPNSDDFELPDNLTINQALESSKRVLLLIILGLIFIESDNKMLESELFQYLDQLGLDLESKSENGLETGKYSIQEMIQREFVREKYLKRIKKPQLDATSPTEYILEWSIRSRIEFKATDILDFIKEIYLDDSNDTTCQIYMKQLDKKAKKYDKMRELILQNKPFELDQDSSSRNNSEDLDEVDPNVTNENDPNGGKSKSVQSQIVQRRSQRRIDASERQSSSQPITRKRARRNQ